VTELANMLVDALGLKDVQFTFTGSSWAGDAQYWKVDTCKLRGIGYAPQVELTEGLKRTGEWFRATYS
jgi:nucleoside-diphosphate-sugar epimerase